MGRGGGVVTDSVELYLERIGRVVVVPLDILRLPVVLGVQLLVHLLLADRLQQQNVPGIGLGRTKSDGDSKLPVTLF